MKKFLISYVTTSNAVMLNVIIESRNLGSILTDLHEEGVKVKVVTSCVEIPSGYTVVPAA